MERHVFFDFDGTLTSCDSFFAFIRFVRGRLGLLRIMAQELPALCGLFFGLTTVEKAKGRLLKRTLKGYTREAYLQLCEEFATRIAKKYERKQVVDQLRDAVKKGEHVAIVSGSPGDWIRAWGRRHGVTDVVATELDFTDRQYSGALATPDCIGAEKKRRILTRWPDLAEKRHNNHITAYGNSSGDLPMLDFADTAYMVENDKLNKIK